jgi:hypothetical protein
VTGDCIGEALGDKVVGESVTAVRDVDSDGTLEGEAVGLGVIGALAGTIVGFDDIVAFVCCPGQDPRLASSIVVTWPSTHRSG